MPACYKRDWAAARADRSGESFGAALDKIGYRGPQRSGDHKLSAFFEVHIEQGPYLEAEGKDIGIVTGVQAMRWYEMTITGQDSHAGTTPMPRRHDALLGAARVVEAVNANARRYPTAVGTVGILEVKPGSPNVIPGEVFLTLDLRDPEASVLDRLEKEIAAEADKIAGELGLTVALKTISAEPAVRFDADCIAAVRAAAAVSGYSSRDMISRAGHDAAFVSRVAPSSMIFVPCKDGISHNEAEYSSKEQCAAGAQVLLQAVLDYDKRLAESSAASNQADHTRLRACSAMAISAEPPKIMLMPSSRPSAQAAVPGSPAKIITASTRSTMPLTSIQPHWPDNSRL